MLCTISNNRLGIKTRILINTRVNGFVFIDQQLARKASQYLDSLIQTLLKQYNVIGYNGRESTLITQYLELNLYIDGRKQLQLPMLIVQLGKQDIILGRSWAQKYRTLIDCHGRQLIQPEDLPESKSWNRVIAIHQKNLFPLIDQEHQEDAQHRDKLIDNWRLQSILRRTWKSDQAKEYSQMNNTLSAIGFPKQAAEPRKRRSKLELQLELKYSIDICGISAIAFRSNLQRRENTFFTTSLYEINCILKERQAGEASKQSEQDRQPKESELQQLRRLLPRVYRDYTNVFSKEASDQLPLH